MYIPNLSNHGIATPPKPKRRRVANAQSARRVKKESAKDRRRQPDRRREQKALTMKDRRRRLDRRAAKLLNARSATPENLGSRKGNTIDTAV